MNVTAVLLNFRSALTAVIPSVESAGISWRRPDAYDEWDAIATTLFEQLVVAVLRWSLPETEQEDFRLPPYDLLLRSYSSFRTLEIVHPSLPEGRWLFHAFGTRNEPLDLIEVREVTDNGLPLDERLRTIPVKDAVFVLDRTSNSQ